MSTRTFSVNGDLVAGIVPVQEDDGYSLQSVIQITPSSRDSGKTVRFELGDENLAALEFEDGTVWFADKETLFDVFPRLGEEFDSLPRDASGKVSDEAASRTFSIPLVLDRDDQQRDIKGLLLKAIKIFVRKAKDPLLEKGVKYLAAQLEAKQLLDHKHEISKEKEQKGELMEGLFSLQPNFEFSTRIPTDVSSKFLLFIHGTASSTFGSFGKLFGSTEWDELVKAYHGKILAFQHRTLTKDPLENAEDLIKQLPDGAELHLVTHSRGGLVADILCRYFGTAGSQNGFSEKEREYWDKKAGAYKYSEKAARIDQLAATKKIRISKVVRVACPASGTTLASKRIEYFFNVILNLLGTVTGQMANPIFNAFKDLIGEIIKQRSNPDSLPGLAAMDPENPFIKVLNHANEEAAISTPLFVLAGNAKPNLHFKALLVIVTRLFFTSKNDMVVNTSSMTNGAMRTENKTLWLLDEGGNVNHFNYFGNRKTQQALLRALLAEKEGAPVEGFMPYQQSLTEGDLRQAKLGLEGGEVNLQEVSGKRPVVLILPGIMGSNLSIKDRKIWINYWQFIKGGLTELEYEAKDVKATSLIKTSYEKLAQRLQSEYDVITWAFDWRKPLKESAGLFAKRIEDLIKLGQPIKIVCHSMGGVLVRDMMVFEHETYKKLFHTPGFQIVFLGSPLGGSYRIPYVLFGFDAIIKTISRIDLRNNMTDLLAMFSQYRGLLCLLPFTTHKYHDFALSDTWQYLCDKLDKDANWPIPSPEALIEFEKYRNAILASSEKIWLGKAVYIAGKDKATPCGYRERPDGGLEFLMTAEGDQSVTWESGIPRQISDEGNVYYAAATHGGLASQPFLFDAILDLLKHGRTDKLSKERPQLRGAKVTIAKDFDEYDTSEAGVERTLLALGTDGSGEDIPGTNPLQVTVSHGDLMYASYPVMAGHFEGDGLFSVERAIDWHLDGELTKRSQLGIYPGRVGTYDLLLLTDDRPKSFKGALIIGLGENGKLTSYSLSQSVEKGVIKYLTVYNSDQKRLRSYTGQLGISTPAIGSGYGGLSVESSMRAIIAGIQQANQNIALAYGDKAITVTHIEFIEIYNYKALDYFFNLTRIKKERDSGLHFALVSNRIGQLPGRRMQTPSDENKDWWTRITVELEKEKGTNGVEQVTGLKFNVSTLSAREEVASSRINLKIIESLLDDASTDNKWNENIARTLYEMLIPNEFKENLNRSGNVFWIVDKDTARIPWELLKNTQNKSKPLCISSGMMRQYSTDNFRSGIQRVGARNAIVIADPDLQGAFNQLPGARQEGYMVEKMLRDSSFTTTMLSNERAANILVSLFSKEYKIVHLAAHGIFEADANKPSGMLIGKNAVLTPAEIKQMSIVPDFVFVNCCHLGAVNAETEKITQQRYKLAANLGTQLMEIGVKAVIVAGWAVDDQAAQVFAEVFYNQFLGGESFGEAVKKARNAAYVHSGTANNTWGAYQAYGDPFFQLEPVVKFRNVEPSFSFVMESQVEMELFNLLSKQETGTYSDKFISDPLEPIIQAALKEGLLSVKSMEYVARIYANLQNYQLAINWFEKLLGMSKATFEVASLEQYCNLRAKLAVEKARGTGNQEKIKESLAMLQEVLADLERISSMGITGERLNLKASTLKRIAQLENGGEKEKYLILSLEAYREALKYFNPGGRYYSLSNWLNLLAIAVLNKSLKWGKGPNPGVKTALLMVDEELKECNARANVSQEYWDRMAAANLQLTSWMISPHEDRLKELRSTYEKVWANAGTRGQVKAEIEQFDAMLDLLNKVEGKGTGQYQLVLKGLQELAAFAKITDREKGRGIGDKD